MVILIMRFLLGTLIPLGLLGSSANAIEPESGDPFLDDFYAILDAKDPPPTREAMLEEYHPIASSNKASDRLQKGNDGRLSERTKRSSSSWRRNRSHHIGDPGQNTQASRSQPMSASPSALLQSTSILAQSAGRGVAPVHGGFGAYSQRTEHANPNLSIGPLDLSFTWKAGLESSDNFFHRQDDREDSMSLSAGFFADGQWSLTEHQSLSLTLGLGADYWLDGPGRGTDTGDIDFNITPGSQIDYLILIGETIELRVYDHLTIQRNRQRNEFSLDERSVSDQWLNAAGAQAKWAINDRLTMEAGYEYGKRHSLESRFSDNNYDWQTASLGVSLTDGATLITGIESRSSWSNYEDSDRNDASSASLGAFASWTPTDYTSLLLSFGVERWRFDESDAFPASSQNHFYGSLGLSNQLNEDFRQTISIGRSSSLSDFSNLSQTNYVRYGFDWDASDATRINGYISYNRSDELGSGRSEQLTSRRFGVSLQQDLSEYVSVGLGGHYADYDSNLDNRNYKEQRGQAWMSWHVNKALSVTASFEHWRSNGDANFEENRVLFGTSLSF